MSSFLGAAVGVLFFLSSTALSAAEPASTPPLAALKECLAKPLPANNECLELLFRAALEQHSPAEMLRLVERYEDEDAGLRLACHPVVHALGREIFRVKGNIHDSFQACDQTCHSGCYHGAVERFLRGDGAAAARHVTESEILQRAPAACDAKAPRRIYFQCLHGLGHALMYFTENRLDLSLQGCDALADGWSRNSCYGGVFMESVAASNPDNKQASGDYHYPCNAVAEKFRAACYLMQTTRMQEMGLSTGGLFIECRKAGPYEADCAQSIGRDLSNAARAGESRPTAEKCGLGEGEARRACIRGAVYALIDNTWNMTYAAPFCAALDGADAAYCEQAGGDYLKMFIDK